MPIDFLVYQSKHKQRAGRATADVFTHRWNLSITTPYLTFQHFIFSTEHAWVFPTTVLYCSPDDTKGRLVTFSSNVVCIF